MDRRHLLAAIAAGLAGCGGDGEVDAPATPPAGSTGQSPTAQPTGSTAIPDGVEGHRGISLSPASYGGEDVTSFFEVAATLGSAVRWAGDWNELGPDSTAAVVAQLADRYDYTPVVEVGVADGEGRLVRPLDADTRATYLTGLREFVTAHEPPYLGVGVEVNRLASADPDGFEAYVDLYESARETVASASPSTAVYPVWQLEWLRGRRGGLWGGPAERTPTQWDLLDRVEADLAAFTTYPYLVFSDPAAVPADYYAAVDSRTSQALAITEIGWPAALEVEGWESDEAEQVRFVDRLDGLLADLDLALLLWLHLYRQGSDGVFSSVTLRREDGTARPAEAAWQSLEVPSPDSG